MHTITFQCHACQQVLKVSADKAGRKAKCIKCSTILTIPAGTEEEPPAKRVKKSSGAGSEHPTLPLDASPLRLDKSLDEGDRPRKRRRDLDDEEDDDVRPRSRKNQDDEDEDFDDDRPRQRKGSSGKANWPKISVGLLIAFIGICVQAGGFCLAQIGMLCYHIGAIAGSRGMVDAFFILMKIGVVVISAGLVTAIVGFGFWLLVTNKKGALAFAIATLSLAAVSLILNLVFVLIPMFDSNPFRAFGGANLGGGLRLGNNTAGVVIGKIIEVGLTAALWILTALYLRAIAQTLKDRHLAGRGMLLVILSSVAYGFQIFLFVLTMILMESMTGSSRALGYVLMILYWIGAGLLIFKFIMYILTTWAVRSLVDEG